jgi:hypothetical protein
MEGGKGTPDQRRKAKPKRLRRRPDPFAALTTELRGWFEAEPWHTSRELLERLQAQCPGVYPEGQLRTLQRRLKEWRREAAQRMVLGTMTADPGVAPGDGEGSLLSNGANDYFSDREGSAKSPVDLPLFELSVPGDGQSCCRPPPCAARLLGMDRRIGAGVPRFSSFVMRGKPFHDAGFHKGGVGLRVHPPPRQIAEYK